MVTTACGGRSSHKARTEGLDSTALSMPRCSNNTSCGKLIRRATFLGWKVQCKSSWLAFQASRGVAPRRLVQSEKCSRTGKPEEQHNMLPKRASLCRATGPKIHQFLKDPGARNVKMYEGDSFDSVAGAGADRVVLFFVSHRGIHFVTNMFLFPVSSFPTLPQKQREVHSVERTKNTNKQQC